MSREGSSLFAVHPSVCSQSQLVLGKLLAATSNPSLLLCLPQSQYSPSCMTTVSAVLGAVGAAPRPRPALRLVSVPSTDVANSNCPSWLVLPCWPKGAGPHVTVPFCHHTASLQPAAGLAAALLPFFWRLLGIEPLCVASRTERDSQ